MIIQLGKHLQFKFDCILGELYIVVLFLLRSSLTYTHIMICLGSSQCTFLYLCVCESLSLSLWTSLWDGWMILFQLCWDVVVVALWSYHRVRSSVGCVCVWNASHSLILHSRALVVAAIVPELRTRHLIIIIVFFVGISRSSLKQTTYPAYVVILFVFGCIFFVIC